MSIDNKENVQTSGLTIQMLTGIFVFLFCIISVIDLEFLGNMVNTSFQFSTTYFGTFWQFLLLFTFIISLLIALTPAGHIKLGNLDSPEFSTFQWGCMIMCTLLAGGGVFWAAGEPLAHFLSPPPFFEKDATQHIQAIQALAQSFLHWGFLAWSILGSLTTLILMHLHYEKGLPLAPRTLLYPIYKERALYGIIGIVTDFCCIIAALAGTVGPIGFLGLQVGFGLEMLFEIPNTTQTQILVVVMLMCIYILSAISGVNKGIQLLSRVNIGLGLALLLYMFLIGPTRFILNGFWEGMTLYSTNLFHMAMYQNNVTWLGSWTIFFWGWFLGYGPMMAIFISRISRGRSIREIIFMLALVAPLVTNFWFTIIGGSGLGMELTEPGSISKAFEGFNLPAALLAITQNLPFGFFISLLFLILTTIFVATTGDSMTYVLSTATSSEEEPNRHTRIFWGLAMGFMAIILLSIDQSSLQTLQSFIVVTAVPVSFVLLPSLWIAPKIAFQLYKRERAK